MLVLQLLLVFHLAAPTGAFNICSLSQTSRPSHLSWCCFGNSGVCGSGHSQVPGLRFQVLLSVPDCESRCLESGLSLVLGSFATKSRFSAVVLALMDLVPFKAGKVLVVPPHLWFRCVITAAGHT